MESRIKAMLALGVLGVIIPFLGIPIAPKLYILSFLALVYTLITLSLLYGMREEDVGSKPSGGAFRETENNTAFDTDTYDRNTDTAEKQNDNTTSFI